MRPENYIRDNLPTARQVGSLSRAVLSLAKSNDLLEVVERNRQGLKQYRFKPFVSRETLDDDARYGAEARHHLAAIISRRAVRSWEMTLIDGYHIDYFGKPESGVVDHYQFLWQQDRVFEARRSQHHVYGRGTISKRKKDMYDEIDQFFASDTIASEWDAAMQLEEVTSGDVELMTRTFDTLAASEYSRSAVV